MYNVFLLKRFLLFREVYQARFFIWIEKWGFGFKYEGHTRIIDTPWRFGHWAKSKTLLIAKWRGKTELVEKRESRSAVSKHADKSHLGLDYGRQLVSTALMQSSNQRLHHHVKQ